MSEVVVVTGAAEGLVDAAVLRRLVSEAGAIPGSVHGGNGKMDLVHQLGSYNNAAHYAPWLVLVDLDDDAACAPAFRAICMPRPASKMCFRIAVREIESWLMADQERLARFLSVALSKIPLNPDAVANPKQTVVDIARKSRRKEIREDMVPRPGSGRKVGPAYASRLIEFASDEGNGWRPLVAAGSSDSLRRCLERLGELVQMPR